MTQIIYDGTYEGWLTAVFDIYSLKLSDVVFARKGSEIAMLIAKNHETETDSTKARRVLAGLKERLSATGTLNLYQVFLSEIDKFEEVMFRYCRHVLDTARNVEQDLSHPAVAAMRKAIKLINKEAHRMEAFVRFQLTSDQLYYAIIDPVCNVLPLIENHFRNRYADQRWLIYDSKRRYGLYYDLHEVSIVALSFHRKSYAQNLGLDLCDETEVLFQSLWQQYFSSVNISERKNMRLHLQHLPKRYWKHLPEKTVR